MKNHKLWLKNRIERDYGKRCPDYVEECYLCQAWKFYDEIINEPRCDYKGKCKNRAFKEVFPGMLGGKCKNIGWSYLCKKHYYREQRTFKGKLPSSTVCKT